MTEPKGLRTGTWWWTALVIVIPVVVLTAIAVTVLLATIDIADAKDRIELVKTGLAVGAGTGGVVALVLAGRRQWATEQNARATEHDATERRVTELYTKAADQLGSEKAAVRLAGLYALERLGQNSENQRETILSLVCAYLRMSPADDSQEQQVRLTAQRILVRHRRYRDANWWDVSALDLTGADLSGAQLFGIQLGGANLSGAILRNADLSDANLSEADLTGADLTGARLYGANTAKATGLPKAT